METRGQTLDEQFSGTYIKTGPMYSYILLPALLTNRKIGQNPEILLVPEGKPKNFVEFEGVPAYKIRHKLRKAILKRGDSPTGLYGALNQIFNEAAIKMLFLEPNVWLLRHNAFARKQQKTDQYRHNYLREHNKAGLALHNQCLKRTGNRSVVQSAREERSLSA